jgi:hypothetical protein
MKCNAMFFQNPVMRDRELKFKNLRALLGSGAPGRDIGCERTEGVGAIGVRDELAVGLTAALVDVDDGSAVVEVATILTGDLEAGGSGLRDDSVVLLETASEGVGEVIVGISVTGDWSVRVSDITLHAAGEDRNAGSLNHGDGGQDSESSGGELHIGG